MKARIQKSAVTTVLSMISRRLQKRTLSPLDVVESVTIVVPGLSRSTTVAKNAINRLRLMASPFLSTTPLLSTSVSRTMPRSAPTFRTASMVGAIASGSCRNMQNSSCQSSVRPRGAGGHCCLHKAGGTNPETRIYWTKFPGPTKPNIQTYEVEPTSTTIYIYIWCDRRPGCGASQLQQRNTTFSFSQPHRLVTSGLARWFGNLPSGCRYKLPPVSAPSYEARGSPQTRRSSSRSWRPHIRETRNGGCRRARVGAA